MEEQEEEDRHRTRWSSNIKFNLALFSYTLGLEKVRWGSRAIIHSKLAGAAPIPLLLIAIAVKIPYTFLELSLGQYSGKAGPKMWDTCPIFRGISYFALLSFFLYQVNYQGLCSYAIFYMLLSFKSESDFWSCDQNWATLNCYSYEENISRHESCNLQFGEEYCDNLVWEHSTVQFWKNRVLKLDETGRSFALQPELVTYGFAVSAITFWANAKGTKYIEGFLYFLHIVPFIQLFGIIYGAITDVGGLEGLIYSLTPNFKNFFSVTTWIRAMGASLISSGVGFGAYTALGTQCSFRNPIYLKVISVGVIDCFAVFLYCIIQYCYMGVIKYNTGIKIDDMLNMPDPILWTVLLGASYYLRGPNVVWVMLFYSNVFLIGLRSFIMMICIDMEIVYNFWPRARHYDTRCALVCTLTIFVVSLLLYTESGFPIFRSIDRTFVYITLPLLNVFQMGVLAYGYGVTNFLDDSHFMLGIKPPTHWTVFFILTPIIFLATYISGLMTIVVEKTNDVVRMLKYLFPNLGYAIVISYAFGYWLIKRRHIFQPSPDWGACILSLRKSRQMFSAHSMTKEYMYRQNRIKDRFKHEESDFSSD